VLHTILITLGISETKGFDECYGKGMDKTKASMHDDGVDILSFQSKES
jgi:hypothetical protein